MWTEKKGKERLKQCQSKIHFTFKCSIWNIFSVTVRILTQAPRSLWLLENTNRFIDINNTSLCDTKVLRNDCIFYYCLFGQSHSGLIACGLPCFNILFSIITIFIIPRFYSFTAALDSIIENIPFSILFSLKCMMIMHKPEKPNMQHISFILWCSLSMIKIILFSCC